MNLKNIIVTWNALNSQTENIKAVCSSNGDYTIAFKKHQKTTYYLV